ncbi:hypothetical protein KY289_027149 [Solanum tuberosum]|nr:hypothetical protein KY289_027149 [Solanum tuberosum]
MGQSPKCSSRPKTLIQLAQTLRYSPKKVGTTQGGGARQGWGPWGGSGHGALRSGGGGVGGGPQGTAPRGHRGCGGLGVGGGEGSLGVGGLGARGVGWGRGPRGQGGGGGGLRARCLRVGGCWALRAWVPQ